MVISTGLSAKIGAEGWYFESWRAVEPGLREQRDAAQVQIVGGVGRGFADRLGDGQVAAALRGARCSRSAP